MSEEFYEFLPNPGSILVFRHLLLWNGLLPPPSTLVIPSLQFLQPKVSLISSNSDLLLFFPGPSHCNDIFYIPKSIGRIGTDTRVVIYKRRGLPVRRWGGRDSGWLHCISMVIQGPSLWVHPSVYGEKSKGYRVPTLHCDNYYCCSVPCPQMSPHQADGLQIDRVKTDTSSTFTQWVRYRSVESESLYWF